MNAFRLDWPRCEPRRGDVDRHQLERHRAAIEAAPSATIVLYTGAHPTSLGTDFWLDIDSPEVFRDWTAVAVDVLGDIARSWVPLDRPNALALERYVRGKGRRVRMATGFAIRCLDNMVSAHALATDVIRSKQPDGEVRFTTEAYLEYELDRLAIDLLAHRERGISQSELHSYLVDRRRAWYSRVPATSPKQRLVRHYTKSGIPLEQAFPRAQAAIAKCAGRLFDAVDVGGLDRLAPNDRDAYIRGVAA